ALIAKDSRQPATKRKPPTTRPRCLATLGMNICSVIARCGAVTPNDQKLSDGGLKTRRLQPECDAAVRCSAWLGVRRDPRLTNRCVSDLSNVALIAEDSRQPATKCKQPTTRSFVA